MYSRIYLTTFFLPDDRYEGSIYWGGGGRGEEGALLLID